jgi:DNA-binding phage protein
MAKKKTSAARKKSSVKLTEFDTTQGLTDPSEVLDALLKCLVQNDVEGFRDIFVAHLHIVSKSKLSLETKLGRRTLYDLMDQTKPFNPTLSTVAPILASMAKRKAA